MSNETITSGLKRILYRDAARGGNREMSPDEQAPPGYCFVVPVACVSTARALLWHIGERPLPCAKEENWESFFQTQWWLTDDQQHQKLKEHRRLTLIEQGYADPTAGLPDEFIAELVRLGWQPPRAVTRANLIGGT